jgi:hypothetical protein
MDGPQRRAGAALALAALLFARALARQAPPPADCPAPQEGRAAAGHTVELVCRAPGPGPAVRGPARRLVGLAIDPNRADAATLATLPGIGPGRAAAIVEARRQGRFGRLEDLDRVPGIGPRTLAGLAGLVGFEPSGREGRLGPPRPDPVGCDGGCGRPAPQGDR